MSGDALGMSVPAMSTTRLGGIALGTAAAALTAYQFGVSAWLVDHAAAEHAALQVYWPLLVVYVMTVGLAAYSVPRAIARALAGGDPTAQFSLACLAAAIAGCVLYVTVGVDGIGSPTMAFYWGGLAALWSGAIAMIHLCRRWRKPLAVRDWTIYAAAIALIPLTMIPSVPLWPLMFDLDPGQTIMTAATSSFATHLLVAHYIIFEILERRPRRN